MPTERVSVTVLAAAPPGLLLGWWTLDQGGYPPGAWLPGAIAVVVLAALAWWFAAASEQPPLPWAARVALGAFVAFTAWSYLSVLWADAPGAALQGSHRTLLYLAAFALAVRLPWSARLARGAAIALVAMITIAGIVTLVRLGRADAAKLFIDARLAEPTGYSNADAALWTMGALPALVLAASRTTPWLLRPLLLGASALLLELALVSQSRGWLFTLPVVLAILVAITPGRLRLVVFAAVPAAAILIARPDLLAPYDVGNGQGPATFFAAVAHPAHQAASTAATMAVAAVVAGLVMVLLDRRLPHDSPVLRRGGRIAGAAVVVALVAGGAGAAIVATHGHPLARLQHAWDDFKDPNKTAAAGQSHFSALGSGRYDFWRVAVDLWRDHPVGGVGQDNFAQPYVRLRASPLEETLWVHSFPLRLLAHTGTIGALLFVVFLVAGALATRRRSLPEWGPVRAALLLPVVVWLVHGSVDWLWEFPALSVGALMLAGVAIAGPAPQAGGEAAAEAPSRRRRGRTAATASLGLAAVIACVALGAAFLADRETAAAAAEWGRDPGRAFDRLRLARDLDPLSARPLVIEGLIAGELGRNARARDAFRRAGEREPQDWYAPFQEALLTPRRERAAARRALVRAHTLNPLEPVIDTALQRLSTRRPLTFRESQAPLLARLRLRIGR